MQRTVCSCSFKKLNKMIIGSKIGIYMVEYLRIEALNQRCPTVFFRSSHFQECVLAINYCCGAMHLHFLLFFCFWTKIIPKIHILSRLSSVSLELSIFVQKQPYFELFENGLDNAALIYIQQYCSLKLKIWNSETDILSDRQRVF